jgi:XTP/dITP diphosphohydrolase
MAAKPRIRTSKRGSSIAFYTTNPGKVHEVETLLQPLGYKVLWRKRSLLEPQAECLEEVVKVKLGAVSSKDLVVMVEDSGLFVKSLGGFPGVYSSYVMKTIGPKSLIPLLEGKDRAAEFRAVIGLREMGRIRFFTGIASGAISTEARGTGGFGFDPVFIPEGESRTMAEMGTEEKNLISHRGKALRALLEHLERGARSPRKPVRKP